MQIINYFESSNKEGLITKIERSKWSAAKFLVKLLRENTFDATLGKNGKLFLLMDKDSLLSFVTLTQKDCIDDESLFPWLGFLYTFPEYRGNRYSEKLIAYAAEDAKKQGFQKVYLATDHVGMYEKYGFEYIENRIDVWGEDDRIYVKDLI